MTDQPPVLQACLRLAYGAARAAMPLPSPRPPVSPSVSIRPPRSISSLGRSSKPTSRAGPGVQEARYSSGPRSARLGDAQLDHLSGRVDLSLAGKGKEERLKVVAVERRVAQPVGMAQQRLADTGPRRQAKDQPQVGRGTADGSGASSVRQTFAASLPAPQEAHG